jgi:coenzyme F420 hydrogenase subunit beta
MNKKNGKGSKELMEEVWAKGLCTLCGACVGGCPYFAMGKNKVVSLDRCIIAEGQCYKYCPRTPSDIDKIYLKVLGVPFSADLLGVGVINDVFLARTTDQDIAKKAQDGGTVTTLLATAFQEKWVDCALISIRSPEKPQQGFLARNKAELLQGAGNSYEMSPVLETLNNVSRESNDRMAVVGLPCQVMALGKMRTEPPQNRVKIDHVRLVVGLFCGWALSPESFFRFLKRYFDIARVTKYDIPHHPAHSFDLYTDEVKNEIDLEQIRGYIHPACGYCWDMTSQFADVSVGSGRAMFRGWNTLIVRTDAGAKAVELAKQKGLLETQPIPAENLQHLRTAALSKAKRAVKNLVKLTGSEKDLAYLEVKPAIRTKLLKD